VADLSHPLSAVGLGIALGASPGPVQLLIFSEASRGGMARGLKAMLGANAAFGVMLLALAAGLSSIEPGETFLRVMRVVGGAFLVWLAWDAVREARRPEAGAEPSKSLHPSVRGIVAVVVNPGVYVFLATTGTAVTADAADAGGRGLAAVTVLALLAGVSCMDMGMVMLGGGGARRMSDRALRLLGDALAAGLAALGLWLVVQGFRG
jgi:threonine/homoserine/homoserine lactone efflux protein